MILQSPRLSGKNKPKTRLPVIRGRRHPGSATRYLFVDIWRGVALLGVVIYHLVWDLAFFGYLPWTVIYNLPFTVFARSLAGSFMFITGISLVLAHRAGIKWSSFFRRLAILAVAAISISIVTFLTFPEQFIYFGILHSIAAASLLGLAFLFVPVPLVLTAAAVVVVAPALWETPLMNPRYLAWVGFAESAPPSNDFEPLFPWFAITLAGIGLTRLYLSRQLETITRRPPESVPAILLAWIGQRTLALYLVHQPVLFALFMLVGMMA